MNVKSNPYWHHQYQRRQCCVLRGCCQTPSGIVCSDQKILYRLPPPHQLSLLTGGRLISHPRWNRSTVADVYWRTKQRFFFKIILGVSNYLEAETEARIRMAAPKTATLLRWIYNSHFSQCQEDTELLMNHFSTAVNRLGWTSGMHFFFVCFRYHSHSKALNLSIFTYREWLCPTFLNRFTWSFLYSA